MWDWLNKNSGNLGPMVSMTALGIALLMLGRQTDLGSGPSTLGFIVGFAGFFLAFGSGISVIKILVDRYPTFVGFPVVLVIAIYFFIIAIPMFIFSWFAVRVVGRSVSTITQVTRVSQKDAPRQTKPMARAATIAIGKIILFDLESCIEEAPLFSISVTAP